MTAQGVTPILDSNSVLIKSGFKSSHLFLRAQGNLQLNPNAGSAFYWPGLMYLSTVQKGKLASVNTSGTISLNGGSIISNALPVASKAGAGVYLMGGYSGITQVVTNKGSVVNLTKVPSKVTTVLPAIWQSKPTGNVVTFGTKVPATGYNAYTPPAG